MTAPHHEFLDVYEQHVWDVYGFLGYRLDSREEAEDLTQATFERALKAWSSFDADRGDAKAWLIAIARNLLRDHYRRASVSREKRLVARSESAIVSEPSDAVLGPSPELAAALNQLTHRQREIIALRFGADMTAAEIANQTGLSVSNVQQIISRALRRLRELLGCECD